MLTIWQCAQLLAFVIINDYNIHEMKLTGKRSRCQSCFGLFASTCLVMRQVICRRKIKFIQHSQKPRLGCYEKVWGSYKVHSHKHEVQYVNVHWDLSMYRWDKRIKWRWEQFNIMASRTWWNEMSVARRERDAVHAVEHFVDLVPTFIKYSAM